VSQGISVSVNSQVAYADVLLVTKEPVAGPAETEAAIAAAQALSPRAIVRRGSTTEHAAWLEQVLADPAIERVETERSDGHDHDHVHDESCRDADSHAHGVDSTYLEVEAPLDIEELEDQLAELPPNYVRIKGIVRGADGRWTVIHRVGVRVSSEPFERQPDVTLGQNGRIVALGTNLSSEKLAECLRPAYVP
jgi:G3E family GTPase